MLWVSRSRNNVPDLRNSKVVGLIRELESYGVEVHVHDPVADPAEAQHEYGVELQDWDALPQADAIVLGPPTVLGQIHERISYFDIGTGLLYRR